MNENNMFNILVNHSRKVIVKNALTHWASTASTPPYAYSTMPNEQHPTATNNENL